MPESHPSDAATRDRREYVRHVVRDRNTGMETEVKDGDVAVAARSLTYYLRRHESDRPVDLYEEKTTTVTEYEDLIDPREVDDDAVF